MTLKRNSKIELFFDGEFAELLRAFDTFDWRLKAARINDAIEFLLAHEKKHGVALSYVYPKPFVEFEVAREAAWVKSSLHPFMSSIRFPLSGAEAQSLAIIDRSNRVCGASFRQWGALTADWANCEAWNGMKRWDYLDFYANDHFGFHVRDFEKIMKSFRHLINKKDRALGLHKV